MNRFIVLSILFYMPTTCYNTPLISIITSVYNGDCFIEQFLADIVQQTVFDQCELIIIDAASPGDESVVIARYMQQYPNIIYKRLDVDPGLYAVWNIAISISQGQYITNANLDDRLRYDCYQLHANALNNNPDIDLVYSDFYVTYYPNETFYVNRYHHVRTMAEFSHANMVQPLPNNHPMWRRSFHDKYGLFDEKFKYAGDYELWLRAVRAGAVFKKVPGILGIYFYNPNGISTNSKKRKEIKVEEAVIMSEYADLFAEGGEI